MASAVTLRALSKQDMDQIVDLSLLAWEPVFESFRNVLGPKIYDLIYPDWRTTQSQVVQEFSQKDGIDALVAEVDGQVAGFISYELHKDETAEVMLLAVHPEYQNRGIGTALNNAALDNMRAAGIKLAVVGTGGDKGHAPARRSYEKAGYTGLPLVRYYQDL